MNKISSSASSSRKRISGKRSIFVTISTFQGRFWPVSKKFSFFSFFFSCQGQQCSPIRADSKEIYLFLDGDVPLPRSSIYLALRDIFHPYFPSRTFLPSNYFFLLLLFRRPLPPSDISSLCCFPPHPGRKLCGNAVSSDLNFRI